MERKPNESSSCNCGGNTAKKSIFTQLEWGEIARGALRCLADFNTLYRAGESAKSLIEWIINNNPFS